MSGQSSSSNARTNANPMSNLNLPVKELMIYLQGNFQQLDRRVLKILWKGVINKASRISSNARDFSAEAEVLLQLIQNQAFAKRIADIGDPFSKDGFLSELLGSYAGYSGIPPEVKDEFNKLRQEWDALMVFPGEPASDTENPVSFAETKVAADNVEQARPAGASASAAVASANSSENDAGLNIFATQTINLNDLNFNHFKDKAIMTPAFNAASATAAHWGGAVPGTSPGSIENTLDDTYHQWQRGAGPK